MIMSALGRNLTLRFSFARMPAPLSRLPGPRQTIPAPACVGQVVAHDAAENRPLAT